LKKINNKKSITLIEIIFSIVLLSIVLISSADIILHLNKKNNEDQELLVQKIDFESTRLFLQKNKNLDKLTFLNNTLYYKNDILLKNVYTFSRNNNIISLCIKNKIKNCQEIIIKNGI